VTNPPLYDTLEEYLVIGVLGRNNYGDFGDGRKILTILILALFQLKIKLRIQKDAVV
jgi:hypothetical protein